MFTMPSSWNSPRVMSYARRFALSSVTSALYLMVCCKAPITVRHDARVWEGGGGRGSTFSPYVTSPPDVPFACKLLPLYCCTGNCHQQLSECGHGTDQMYAHLDDPSLIPLRNIYKVEADRGGLFPLERRWFVQSHCGLFKSAPCQSLFSFRCGQFPPSHLFGALVSPASSLDQS